jgi:hypothetical protein
VGDQLADYQPILPSTLSSSSASSSANDQPIQAAVDQLVDDQSILPSTLSFTSASSAANNQTFQAAGSQVAIDKPVYSSIISSSSASPQNYQSRQAAGDLLADDKLIRSSSPPPLLSLSSALPLSSELHAKDEQSRLKHDGYLDRSLKRTIHAKKGGAEKERKRRSKILKLESSTCQKVTDIFCKKSAQAVTCELDIAVDHMQGETEAMEIDERHSEITAALQHNPPEDNIYRETLEIDVDSHSNQWPSVWSKEQYNEFCVRNTWLDCRDGNLGCKVCSNAAHLPSQHGFRILCASEWIHYKVSCHGNERKIQLQALRTKVHRHRESASHIKCMDTSVSSQPDIATAILGHEKEHERITTILFRTAYYIAKQDRPYSDYEPLIQLQQLNGIDTGITLHSRYSGSLIIAHIANVMKSTICKQLVERNVKISVLIDESTTVSHLSVLCVYVKASVDGVTDPVFVFLDLIELPNQTADTIARCLLECLSNHGFTRNFLEHNMICFACDGASVMLGRRSGVATLLQVQFPSLIIWHCLNHRLELAVHDTLKEVSATNHFKIFIDSLYSLYSQSPKNQRELKEAARELDIVINKIGRILDTRWVASSFRTVAAVWKAYLPLCRHFEEASQDNSRSSTERAKYAGLLRRLHSPQFLKDCALLHDTLDELANLSELLQARSMSLPRAHKLMVRCIRLLDSFRDIPGDKMKEAAAGIEAGFFKGVPLENNAKIQSINEKQFLASLVIHMRQRLLTAASSNTSRTATIDGTSHEQQLQNKYNDLIEELSILEPDSWPADDGHETVHFGEPEISRLTSRFGLDKRMAINGFRDFVDGGGRSLPDMLRPLMLCARTLPCSTAECERAFSCMNVLISPLRNSLLISNVSALLFIKINGPPLAKINFLPYVKLWLLNHSSATDIHARRLAYKENNESNASDKSNLWALL